MAIIFSLLLLAANCGNQMSAQQGNNGNSQSNNLNSNRPPIVTSEVEKVDKARLEELDKQNEKFRQVPDEWKKVDFKNFKYPSLKLTDGEYVIDNHKDCDHRMDDLEEVFYVDLNGDGKKEAIPHLNFVTCGCGSCSGIYHSFYFYSLKAGNPKLILEVATGCLKYGCGLKLFHLEKDKLTVELYGDCQKESSRDANKTKIKDGYYGSGFASKDITKITYQFRGDKALKTSVELTETEIRSAGDTKISINE